MRKPLEPMDGRVEIEDGVVFGHTGARGRELRADIFTPPDAVKDRPAVLLVHGGGWQNGDRGQLRGYGIALARLGYLCVACEYRLSGEAVWPAQVHDVKAALRFMRANSSELGLDPARIAVSGNSAGAHLSLMLGATPDAPQFEGEGGNAGVGTGVAAVVAFYAPTVLRRTDIDGAVDRLFGPGVPEEVLRAASPVEHARKDFPPTLLAHGSKDETVPVTASLVMHEALTSAGAPVELHIYNDLPHAFDSDRTMGKHSAQLIAQFLDRNLCINQA